MDLRLRAQLSQKYPNATFFEWKTWYLREAKTHVTLYYAWRNDVIIGIGSSFEDLLK